VAEKLIHRDVERHGDPPQGARPGQTCFSALDLIERRPGDFGTAGELIRTPAFGIPEVTNALGQGDHGVTSSLSF
jgi:hypothetical protein